MKKARKKASLHPRIPLETRDPVTSCSSGESRWNWNKCSSTASLDLLISRSMRLSCRLKSGLLSARRLQSSLSHLACKMQVRILVILLTSCCCCRWSLALAMGDMSGALTGILLAKMLTTGMRSNNQPAPSESSFCPRHPTHEHILSDSPSVDQKHRSWCHRASASNESQSPTQCRCRSTYRFLLR